MSGLSVDVVNLVVYLVFGRLGETDGLSGLSVGLVNQVVCDLSVDLVNQVVSLIFRSTWLNRCFIWSFGRLGKPDSLSDLLVDLVNQVV